MRQATRILDAVTRAIGSIPSVTLWFALVLLWLAAGWFVPGRWANQIYQITFTTFLSIVTLWMAVLIEYTQQRDARANQTKMDAQGILLTAIAARVGLGDHPATIEVERLIGIEDEPEATIEREQEQVRRPRPPSQRGWE